MRMAATAVMAGMTMSMETIMEMDGRMDGRMDGVSVNGKRKGLVSLMVKRSTVM